jgi:hypothetical protein
MNHYLVVFDRSTGKVLRHKLYGDRDDALAARFAAEREHATEPAIEVVVLGARSWDDVKRTHGRYFKGFGQLAASS